MPRKGNKSTDSFVLIEGHYLVGNEGIYKVCEFIGEGSFGKVAKCSKLGSQQFYAIKTVKSHQAGQRELESLERIKALDPEEDHVIKMYECFSFQKMTCMVFEILEESLHKTCKKILHPCFIRPLAQHLLKALKALKSVGMTHCDIKPNNIMFTDPNSMNVKLIDFGLAMETKNLSVGTDIQITPYKAPEVILGLPLDEGVDMWAVGIVLACAYFGNHPFPRSTEYDTIRALVQIFGLPDAEVLSNAKYKKGFFILDENFDDSIWRLQTPEEHEKITGNQVTSGNHVTDLYSMIEVHQKETEKMHDEDDHRVFIDLLKHMLEVNPKKRITPSQALTHDFITRKHLSGESKATYAAAAELAMSERKNPFPFVSSCVSKNCNGSLKTPVSDGPVANNTDMNEVCSAGSEDKQSTHPSLNSSPCDHCEEPVSKENLEKAEDLETDMNKIKRSSEIKTKEKSFEIKKGQLLEGNLGSYKVGDLLGAGTFGKVFECCKVGSEETVAIKIIQDVHEGKEEIKAMELIKDLDPDKNNLLKFFESFMYNNLTCLVYETLNHSLQLCMENRKPSFLCNIRVIAQQMFQALDALKSIGVLHGDLKPDNILFAGGKPLRIKLIDFGWAKKAEDLSQGTDIQVTPFKAPEVLLGLPLDESIDMWALGVVLACLYCGDYPFPYETEYETMRAMVQLFGLPEEELLNAGYLSQDFFTRDGDGSEQRWRLLTAEEFTQGTGQQLQDEDHVLDLDAMIDIHKDLFDHHDKDDHRVFIDLLKRMLEVNPENRITPSEALAHDFITMKHLAGKKKAKYAAKAKDTIEKNQFEKKITKKKKKKLK